MREILFRGKAACGIWVYGDLIHRQIWSSKFEVIRIEDNGFDNYTEYEIATDTIGQYTGLTDKNGTKIFEGDIVVMNIKGYNTICKVAWADNVAQFQLWQKNTIPHTPTALNLGDYDCEVIGNIHDNPELLKELG